MEELYLTILAWRRCKDVGGKGSVTHLIMEVCVEQSLALFESAM